MIAPRKIMPVASHYTNHAMPVSNITVVDYSVGAGILFPGVRQPECDITHHSPVPGIRPYGTLPPLLLVFIAQRQHFSVTDSIECNFLVTEAVCINYNTYYGLYLGGVRF